jgi:hypothetical protein
LDNEKTLPGDRKNPLRIKVKHEGDRRIYGRVPTLTVVTKVKVKPSMLRTPDWEPVNMIDYNRNGFAFLSRNEYKLGQSLKVYFRLVVDQTEVTLENIFVTIKSTSLEKNHLRYGAEFNFEANDHMRSPQLKAKLSGVERMVKRALDKMSR